MFRGHRRAVAGHAELDHDAVGVGELRDRVVGPRFQIEHHADDAGLRERDANLLQQPVVDRNHLHPARAGLAADTGQVQEDAVGAVDPLDVVLRLGIGLDGDAGHFPEGPEADGRDLRRGGHGTRC